MQEYWLNDEQSKKDIQDYIKEHNVKPKLINNNDGIYTYKISDFIVKSPESLESKYDPLIYGKNQTENITSISHLDGKFYIFKNDGTHEEIPGYYYILGDKQYSTKFTRLEGKNYYKFIREYDKYEDYVEGKHQAYKFGGWSPRDPVEGLMLKIGYTYFKGMKANEPSVLAFDIETTTVNPRSEDARVVLISNTLRKNGVITKKLFDINSYNDDTEMIKSWAKWVKEVDPAILCGHNIFSFDLDYLNVRSEYNLSIGKMDQPLVFAEKPSLKRKDGSQSYEYYNATVFGREIIDTMFLALTYDVGRKFPSYGLKPIIEFLGLEKEGRIKWDFKVNSVFETMNNPEKWKQFKEYCQDDGDDALALFDLMIPSFFYLNQSIPKTLQQMINTATGTQINSFMIRSYLQNNQSIAKTTKVDSFEGGISMGIPGIYENVRKVDVASLYPSIMLSYDIYDKYKDPNRNMLKSLEIFRDERLKNKDLAEKTNDKYYDDLQNSQKIVINSMYGFMGAEGLNYNYPNGAALVTKMGRETLLKGVQWATGHEINKVIKKVVNAGKENERTEYEWVLGPKVEEGQGYTLVNVDTDSFSYYTKNKTISLKEEFKKEINELNAIFPDLIKWADDGLYDKVVVLKAKNYILKKNKNWCKSKELDSNGEAKITLKGSSLKDQKKEPALKEMLDVLIKELVNSNDLTKLNEIVQIYKNEAQNVKNVNRWCTKKTYTEKVRDGERKNEIDIQNAINEALNKGIINRIQEGDKIYLYNALNGMRQKKTKGELQFYKDGRPKMEKNDILKFPELFDNDFDTEHYLDRIDATVEILSGVLKHE